ncbi:thiamine pyrophosphate-binding protein [Chryseomicrobium sp. FSL W7-1435]|uniref:thiamine pyrophosphate-binding protein n=1 Tax=Chryseomicrobium sp. FSL W7-1435 TaxID=2921704 RepID=UPI00315B3342
MKAARIVLDYLKHNGVEHIFGIPAGSVNAFFDELTQMDDITPIVTKHEGAAGYMAAAYAKYTNHLSVAIACSGPGATNLVTGAANAMREHLPVLFITGAVPVSTIGLNASQELDVAPIFRPVTKYSVAINDVKDVVSELTKAVEIALSGVPGPVHIALPIDVQHQQVPDATLPAPAKRKLIEPDAAVIDTIADELISRKTGYILAGQGIRGSVPAFLELAELLNWPIVTTPQAKGYIPTDHPLLVGVYGFAGHEAASELVASDSHNVALIIGSSLGETATNNYNAAITENRFTVQLDFDASVFNRKYEVDKALLGDITLSVPALVEAIKAKQYTASDSIVKKQQPSTGGEDYTTKNVLIALQEALPASTRYTIDIGEFMSYMINHHQVKESHTYEINVHFGAMGSGIGSAIGSKLAEPDRPVVCITGDGCFFMHGMELLTAKEHNLPILFVIMNNARLGMVYHGHNLQFKRTHTSFEQEPVNISAMASAMGIPSHRVTEMAEFTQDKVAELLSHGGPAVLEVYLQDNSTPPMGDRVKFLSSFGK